MKTKDHLLERIRQLDKLTPSETRIAEYFQKKRASLVLETATAIGQATGVSKVTVVRFVSRLGYDGFADFQEGLKKEFLARLESPIKNYSGPDKKQDHLATAVESLRVNLEQIRERNEPELILRAARLLALNPGRIYVLGLLASHGLAHSFWSYANYMRPGVRLLNDANSGLPNQLINAGPEDVLMALTHRRYSRRTDKVIEHFHNMGAKIVLVADSDLAPVAALADVVLVSPSDGPQLFRTNCTSLVLVEALVAAMTDLLEDKLHDRFGAMDGLFEEFDSFHPGFDVTLGQRAAKRRKDRPAPAKRIKRGK